MAQCIEHDKHESKTEFSKYMQHMKNGNKSSPHWTVNFMRIVTNKTSCMAKIAENEA